MKPKNPLLRGQLKLWIFGVGSFPVWIQVKERGIHKYKHSGGKEVFKKEVVKSIEFW